MLCSVRPITVFFENKTLAFLLVVSWSLPVLLCHSCQFFWLSRHHRWRCFFVSVLLITVQTCPFLALLLLVPHIFIFPHFKYNHCYHNYHYCYHHHHHIISTQITSRQWLRQLDQASALRFIRSMDFNGHVNLLSSQIPTAHSSWKRCAADDLSWRPNSQNPRPYQEGGRMETRIFQGIFLHPRRGKGLGSLARTVHAIGGKIGWM